MKILIDARLYGLENAGLGRYVMNLIDGLAKVDSSNQFIILLRDKYFERLSLPANWTKIRVDIRHYSFKEQIILPIILSKLKPDLVHFPHFNIPLLYFGRFVVTIHDLLMHKFANEETTTLPKPLYLIKRWGYRCVFNKAINSSLKIIVPSLAVKNDLISFYPKTNNDKIICSYEGSEQISNSLSVDTDSVLQRYGLVNKKYFIYIGNAYPHKNLGFAIEVIKQYCQSNKSDIVFAIGSSKNIFVERLEKKIEQENLGQYVKLLGFVEEADLPVLMVNALAYLFPSLDEGFGLPGLEAMKVGTLVLASDIPVFREIYQDNAIYFDPANQESLTKALSKVIGMGENERDEWLMLASKFAESYSWDKMAKEILNVYQSCTSLRSN